MVLLRWGVLLLLACVAAKLAHLSAPWVDALAALAAVFLLAGLLRARAAPTWRTPNQG